MRKRRKSYKGQYIVENKSKYKGKKDPIYRSSWESRFCHMLDTNPNIKSWCFECLIIPYYNEIDKKMHRYITDFCFIEVDKNGDIRKFVVEVKPKTQIMPPKQPKNNNQKAQRRYIEEAHTYVKNRCKWKAANDYCQKKGLEFRLVSIVKENWEVFTIKDIIQE